MEYYFWQRSFLDDAVWHFIMLYVDKECVKNVYFYCKKLLDIIYSNLLTDSLIGEPRLSTRWLLIVCRNFTVFTNLKFD